ncbi:protein-tyrosine phosphatase family protein [Proteus hauseri]|uniref:protein-tyrosine phosphatase family protein n=1 Tax=Proteus hauseri TaxID=183417 RepID=UPI0010096CEC|nr:protein-tyrosine phosphatase family protein [Proteus hauseri]QAV22752.1 hypothetical protein PH4a_05085 [Proteus hauseri]
MLGINFGMDMYIKKINSSSTENYSKGKAIDSSISHICNKNTNFNISNRVEKIVTKISSQLNDKIEEQKIYNQSGSIDIPPELPLRKIKANIPPKLPPRRMHANIPSRVLKKTTLDLNTLVPTQTISSSILKSTPHIFNKEGKGKVANSSDFLTAVNSRLKHDVLDKEDKLNESEKFFNNLISKDYLSSRYEKVDSSRFNIKLSRETLLKCNNDNKLPANIMSGTKNNALRIASQYPLSDTGNMENYLNSLIENEIDTVYILASDDDIKNKLNNEKYFRDNNKYNDVKIEDNSDKSKMILSGKQDLLDLKVYPKRIYSLLKERKVNFVHIHNWKDHTAVDATKLKETLALSKKKLDISPGSNSLIHCLAGVGRTMEMFLVEKMMNMSSAEKQNTSLEEMVHEIREKRTPLALYQIEQLAELTVFALENDIPLLKK